MKLQFNLLLLFSFLIFNGSCQSIKKWISKTPNPQSKRSIASSVNFSDAEWCSINYGESHNKDRKIGMSKALKDNASACVKHLIRDDARSMEALTHLCRDKYGNAKAGFLKALEENSSCVEYFFKKHRAYINTPLESDGTRALMLASNDPEMTQRLLDNGAKPNLRDARGQTALHWAVLAKNLGVVQALLRAKADPNLRDARGQIALHQAVSAKNLGVVQALLRAKADPNLRDARGQTALHQAVSAKNLGVVQALLRAKANPNLRDARGQTALHQAVFENQLKVVKVLLRAKADPNLQDNKGNSAFMESVIVIRKYKHTTYSPHLTINIMKELIWAGAKPNLKNKRGHNVLLVMVMNHQKEFFFTLDPERKEAYLLVMDELYRSGVDFNAQDNRGRTLLMHLSRKTVLDLIPIRNSVPKRILAQFKVLFSRYNKINPNIQDNSGQTALMYMAKGSYVEASQLLLRYGADPNIRDNEGKRALEHVSYGHKGATQLHQILSQITEPNPYAKPEHKRIKTRKPQEGRPFGTL